MEKFTLYVTYKAKKEMGKTFVNEVVESGLRTEILKEKGCLKYDYYYSSLNEDEVFLLEIWEDETAQKEHIKSANMTKLKEIKDKYIIDTLIERG